MKLFDVYPLFDVNIVRGTLDLSDYEERWFNRGQPDELENGRRVRVRNRHCQKQE